MNTPKDVPKTEIKIRLKEKTKDFVDMKKIDKIIRDAFSDTEYTIKVLTIENLDATKDTN